MKKFSWQFILFSFVAAVVILYIVFSNQEGATQEQIITNSLAGGVGMVLGLIIYNKFFNKGDDDKFDLDDH